MSEQQELIKKFKEVTGVEDDEQARFYLESHAWDLEAAATTVLEEGPEDSPTQNATSASSMASNFPNSVAKNVSQPNPTEDKKRPKRGGVTGFSDLASEEDNDEDNVKWYTGGEKSGLQVQAPKKKKDQIIDNVMDSAKALGAQSPSEYQPESTTFSGSGYRLGNQPNTKSQPIPSSVKKEIRKSLFMWDDGFSIDDGPLRQFNDPANKAFMDCVMQGKIPPELQVGQNSQNEITVDLLDKRGEQYKKPQPKPFSGSGQTLGRSSSSVPVPLNTNKSPQGTNTPYTIKVDESQPTTSIQIRLHDGSRIVAKFNLTQKISDIRAYINSTKPSAAYDLMTSFPQKILTDESQTLGGAGLNNAVVIQKLR